MVAVARRPRVTRREAAEILKTSYDNVRRLQRIKQLATTKHDREGTVTYDRREVESLAKKRGLEVKPSGELAARVFAMFKVRKRLEDIVIETQQEPDTILALWQRYQAGLDYGREAATERDEQRAQQEHDQQMREMDRELERRRRGVLFNEAPSTGPGLAKDPVEPEPIRRARSR
jgi:hypothetical protein